MSPSKSKFWAPFATSLALTPILLWIAVASAGAGHGDYVRAKVLFPMTMISAVLFNEIVPPFIVLAIVQYPAYGMILGRANSRDRMGPVLGAVAAVHLLFMALSFAGPQGNF